MRGCLQDCEPVSGNIEGIKIKISCCQEDLCHDLKNLNNSKVLIVALSMISSILAKLFL